MRNLANDLDSILMMNDLPIMKRQGKNKMLTTGNDGTKLVRKYSIVRMRCHQHGKLTNGVRKITVKE